MAKKKEAKGNIKPGKDLVASMAEDLKEKLLKPIEKGAKKLTLDLAKVKAIDSVGLGVIIATHNTLKKAGGKLTLTNASEDICSLFKVMRLDQQFEVKGD